MFNDRKSGYKLPPTTIRDKLISQETRRNKALEEQKRRRAQKIESTRQLDLFASLNLGGSDDEDEDVPEEDVLAAGSARLPPSSVARYAGLLEEDSATMEVQNAISAFGRVVRPVEPVTDIESQQQTTRKKKHVKKYKNKRRTNKPSKWADKCMYAELLEMLSDDQPWPIHGIATDDEYDGLPKDLESGWVAVAPVPAGKRCLAVTHQSAGVVGIAPNTTLRSRLLGKTLIQRFPSSLPPLTILDCILDENWRDNGILHVLDVVKWKGQDVGDCEAGFRFWWRDTRLAELTPTHPPSTVSHPHFVAVDNTSSTGEHGFKYRFPYPTTFVPIPFHTDTTLPSFNDSILPAARTIRAVDVVIPVAPTTLSNPISDESGMDFESAPTGTAFTFKAPILGVDPAIPTSSQRPSPTQPLSFLPPSEGPPPMTHQQARIRPDGLLLYVSEASYEPGTSPLSSWVPIVGYDDQESLTENHPENKEKGKQRKVQKAWDPHHNGPLALFQRLVSKRLTNRPGTVTSIDIEMDV
ncbi:hypothetical protein CPB83DRAFT_911134 [Crepidotus variabilis]|uniref:Snurportin-1 n=1 Tax=Crepidotus variabilis TaxID=179855 RepID=A0A9P6JJ46_9AGAR|nr:hypothetical protein CPB83DRAFT_911134 [Crepidotus variabilis]